MYKIYIKWPLGQKINFERVLTKNPIEAEKIYRSLMKDKRFWCHKAAAMLCFNSTQLECRRFDRVLPADPELEKLVKKGLWNMPKDKILLHYPIDRKVADEMHPNDYIFVYSHNYRDSLILDDETPINLGF